MLQIKGTKTYYVYVYWNPATREPFYVGKGHGSRSTSHLRGTSRNENVIGHCINLRDRGIEPFIEIAYTPTEEDAFWFEKDLIRSLGRKDNETGCLLNHTDGGEGCSGRTLSNSAREQIRLKLLGKKLSENHLEKLRSKIVTEEQKAKISATLKGRKLSSEVCAKMSRTRTGKSKDLHTRAKISESMRGNQNCRGRILSLATRQKIGAARRKYASNKM